MVLITVKFIMFYQSSYSYEQQEEVKTFYIFRLFNWKSSWTQKEPRDDCGISERIKNLELDHTNFNLLSFNPKSAWISAFTFRTLILPEKWEWQLPLYKISGFEWQIIKNHLVQCLTQSRSSILLIFLLVMSASTIIFSTTLTVFHEMKGV